MVLKYVRLSFTRHRLQSYCYYTIIMSNQNSDWLTVDHGLPTVLPRSPQFARRSNTISYKTAAEVNEHRRPNRMNMYTPLALRIEDTQIPPPRPPKNPNLRIPTEHSKRSGLEVGSNRILSRSPTPGSPIHVREPLRNSSSEWELVPSPDHERMFSPMSTSESMTHNCPTHERSHLKYSSSQWDLAKISPNVSPHKTMAVRHAYSQSNLSSSVKYNPQNPIPDMIHQNNPRTQERWPGSCYEDWDNALSPTHNKLPPQDKIQVSPGHERLHVTPRKRANSLDQYLWYFGNRCWQDLEHMFSNAEVGTFLVYDGESNHGRYAIIVQTEQGPICVPIFYENEKFGIINICTFTSVPDMVEFFQSNSMNLFVQGLNIQLIYPASSMEEVSRELQKYDSIDKQLKKKYKEYQRVELTYEKLQEELEAISIDIKRYTQTITLFAHQCEILQTELNGTSRIQANYSDHNAAAENERRICENFRKLQVRLQHIYSTKLSLEGQHQATLDQATRQQDVLKEIKSHMKKLELAGRDLKYANERREEVNEAELYLRKKYPYHAARNNWFFGKEVSKEKATELLQGQRKGTFYIRAKENPSEYTCAVVCDEGKIRQFHIWHKDGSYGVVEPYFIYETLTAFVLHHAENSLAPYNEMLDILAIPVKTVVFL